MLIFNTVIPYLCVITSYLYIRKRIKGLGPHLPKIHFTTTIQSNSNNGFTNSSISASNSNNRVADFSGNGNSNSDVLSEGDFLSASNNKHSIANFSVVKNGNDSTSLSSSREDFSNSSIITHVNSNNNDNSTLPAIPNINNISVVNSTDFCNNENGEILAREEHSDLSTGIIISHINTTNEYAKLSANNNNNNDNINGDIITREDRADSSAAIITTHLNLNNNNNNNNNNNSDSIPIPIKRKSAHYRKVTWLTFRIVLIYGMTWAPSIIYYSIVTMTPDIFDASYYDSQLEIIFTYTIKYITFFNAAAAPVIYCCSHTVFRKEAKKLFMLISGKRTVDESRNYPLN